MKKAISDLIFLLVVFLSFSIDFYSYGSYGPSNTGQWNMQVAPQQPVYSYELFYSQNADNHYKKWQIDQSEVNTLIKIQTDLNRYSQIIPQVPSFMGQFVMSNGTILEGMWIHDSNSIEEAKYYLLPLPTFQYNNTISQHIGSAIIFSWLINASHSGASARQVIQILSNPNLNPTDYMPDALGKNLSLCASQEEYISFLNEQQKDELASNLFKNIIYIKCNNDKYDFTSNDAVLLTRLLVRFRNFFRNRTDAFVILFDRPGRSVTQCLMSKVNDVSEVIVREPHVFKDDRQLLFIRMFMSTMFTRNKFNDTWKHVLHLRNGLLKVLGLKNMDQQLIDQVVTSLNI